MKTNQSISQWNANAETNQEIIFLANINIAPFIKMCKGLHQITEKNKALFISIKPA